MLPSEAHSDVGVSREIYFEREGWTRAATEARRERIAQGLLVGQCRRISTSCVRSFEIFLRPKLFAVKYVHNSRLETVPLAQCPFLRDPTKTRAVFPRVYDLRGLFFNLRDAVLSCLFINEKLKKTPKRGSLAWFRFPKPGRTGR